MMNPKHRLFIFFILMVCYSNAWAAAAMRTESFSLRHRPAEDLVPLLKPFLHPEGAISGSGFNLIIKSTGSNLNQLKDIIADLDVALKRLRISISTDSKAFEESKQIAIPGDTEAIQSKDSTGVQKIIINKGAQHKITTRVYSTAVRSREPKAQHVQLLEGQWATINTGKAVPIADRRINPDGTVTETIRYRKVSSGLKVRAHVSGAKVFLTIRPKQEALSEEGGGQIIHHSLDTTISAKLGEWVELGGTSDTRTSSKTGITYSTRRQHELARAIYVKVELVD